MNWLQRTYKYHPHIMLWCWGIGLISIAHNVAMEIPSKALKKPKRNIFLSRRIPYLKDQLWTRTHLLDVNRRPLEWASQPPVMNGANSRMLPFLELLEYTNCQWHPYRRHELWWTSSKTIKCFAKMSGIQYYNHPGQTTDWRLCYFRWLQCIYLRCPANQRTNWSYWKFSNTCKQDWIEKLPKPCKLHLPWTWIMLQTHFDHYRRQYGIAMVKSLHNNSMQTNHNQIQTCNPWTTRLSNIIAINKRRLQINWTRRHQNDIRRPSSNLSEIS